MKWKIEKYEEKENQTGENARCFCGGVRSMNK